MVIWSDDLDHIVPLCNEFEEKMMKLVWRSRNQATASIITSVSNSSVPSTTASNVNLNEKASAQTSVVVAEAAAATAALVGKETVEPAVVPAAPEKKKSRWGWRLSKKSAPAPPVDPEKGSTPQPRPIRLFAPLYGGLGVGLSICAHFLRRSRTHTNLCSLHRHRCNHTYARVEIGS